MAQPLLYPTSYEERIGFAELKAQIASHAYSSMGRELLLALEASSDYEYIARSLGQCHEMLSLLGSGVELPSLSLVDLRDELQRIRPERSYIEEGALLDLLYMLTSLHAWQGLLMEQTTTGSRADDTFSYGYPLLASLLEDSPSFPKVEQHIRSLIDSEGHIRDNASRELLRIRTELRATERSISGAIHRILRSAQEAGWVEAGVQPAMRDGRLVIPVAPQHKRQLRGIVHDESATGKTVYIEPVELVETNNRIRELEAEAERELIRILTEISVRLRPNLGHLLRAYSLLAVLDSILGKARWARSVSALCPHLVSEPHIEWVGARHPLLLATLGAQGREVVPLDIELSAPERKLLIISGPNAGGKSVCLKTVGLLQYMVQCGLPVSMAESSRVGIFGSFFLDIGDEQSIEDDLSTYSSHLSNMKQFARHCDSSSLLLIDEFGGGTEPTIGGAIAQALLHRFANQGAWGVITTHYQNLKTFAEETEGLINGAMLYDRHEMRPLFRLSIGRPGSSFAIEIARKIGLPEEVIAEASDIVGTDYIDMDKYLQDIVRDKRYWEGKRHEIRAQERRLQQAAEKYAEEVEALRTQRSILIAEAKAEAKRIVSEAGSRVEQTIKEIREAEAEREQTRIIRRGLQTYQEGLDKEEEDKLSSQQAQREVERILERRQRRADRKKRGRDEVHDVAERLRHHLSEVRGLGSATPVALRPLEVGDSVRIEGQNGVGTILNIDGKEASVAMGMLKVSVSVARLRPITEREQQQMGDGLRRPNRGTSPLLIDQIHEKRLHFKTDLDLRGMRVGEAVEATTRFVDEALQLGISRVRILHGTGTGALREAIRQYLRGVGGVSRYADEHVQFGGAGITVVDML